MSSKRGKQPATYVPVPPLAPADLPEPGARSEPRWSALVSHRLPLAFSAVNSGWEQLGLAALVLSRRLGPSLLVGHFVVDLLAFGVVECYGEAFDASDFPRYLAEIEAGVPLEDCPPETCAGLVAEGVRLGIDHGFPPPESLDRWGLLLPPIESSDGAAARAYGPPGRPLAVADILDAARVRKVGPFLSDAVPLAWVVDLATRREH